MRHATTVLKTIHNNCPKSRTHEKQSLLQPIATEQTNNNQWKQNQATKSRAPGPDRLRLKIRDTRAWLWVLPPSLLLRPLFLISGYLLIWLFAGYLLLSLLMVVCVGLSTGWWGVVLLLGDRVSEGMVWGGCSFHAGNLCVFPGGPVCIGMGMGVCWRTGVVLCEGCGVLSRVPSKFSSRLV